MAIHYSLKSKVNSQFKQYYHCAYHAHPIVFSESDELTRLLWAPYLVNFVSIVSMHTQNSIAKTILFWALFIDEMTNFHLSHAYYVYESIAGSHQGPHEKRLLNNLLNNYNTLERPVSNESDALSVRFGLTLQQIIDVVSVSGFDYLFSVSMVLMDRTDSSKTVVLNSHHTYIVHKQNVKCKDWALIFFSYPASQQHHSIGI